MVSDGRRQFLAGGVAVLASACVPTAHPPTTPPVAVVQDGSASLAEVERGLGGRLGVFALQTGSGRSLAHREHERFAMCSTFKWLLAAAVLKRIDREEMALTEVIAYDSSALLDYAPVTRAHLGEGQMTLEALAEASVTVSDNTAANLLLTKLGGPAQLTEFSHSLGDAVTRLDRYEPQLNTNQPGDPRDTTSPHAMVTLMQRVLCGDDVLSVASKEQLLGWIRASTTGKRRLRAGFPSTWLVGDKTGTGERNAVNDVAIALPGDQTPILVAVYMSDVRVDLATAEAAHAEIARLVTREFSV